MKIRVKEDTAGTLWHYPSQHKQATSATVTIYNSAGTEIQASTAATVDSVSTTLASDTARGARQIAVASATGITAGVKYMLVDSGRELEIEVRSVSGTTVYLVQPLTFAASSGATVKGHRLTYALTTTHTQNKDDNYRAHWSYVIATVTYTEDSLFDVVAAVEYYPTTIRDVIARHPRIADLLQTHDLDGFELLRTSWQQRVIPQMDAKGLRIERIKDLSNLIPYHVAIINEMIAEHEAMIDGDRITQLDIARQNSDNMLALYSTDVDWYDEDDDLSESDGEQNRNVSYFQVML